MTTPTQDNNIRQRDAEGNEYVLRTYLRNGGHIPIVSCRDFYTEVALGRVPGHRLVHTFGAAELDTTLRPITLGQVYRTPTTPVTLEVLSDNANDTATGSGAQSVWVEGLDSNWQRTQFEVELNGVTPVTLPTALFRLYRWAVYRSGTYAGQSQGSHAGTLTMRVSGAGDLWSVLTTDPFPIGQSEVGIFTVPAGETAFLWSKNVFVDTSKTANVYFFQRPNADDVVPPYSGTMQLFEKEIGVKGGFSLRTQFAKGPYVGPCDLGFMGLVSVGTAEASVEFELMLVEDTYL